MRAVRGDAQDAPLVIGAVFRDVQKPSGPNSTLSGADRPTAAGSPSVLTAPLESIRATRLATVSAVYSAAGRAPAKSPNASPSERWRPLAMLSAAPVSGSIQITFAGFLSSATHRSPASP
jgi:hypothetical protein